MACTKHPNKNQDFISHLPQPIIHHILSLLTNKDSARTSLLSKTWNNLHASRPTMLFHEQDFIPSDSYIISTQGRTLFMNYVKKSLNRSYNLHTFQLHLCKCGPQAKPKPNHINLLGLHKVFSLNVKTMSLILGSGDNLSGLGLNSHSLVQLHLDCFCFIKACTTINLPSLKVLSLFHVDLPNRALKKLILGSPHVEILSLSHCHTSQTLQLLGLARLLELTVSFCKDVKKVKIGSKNFQSFIQIGQGDDVITLEGCESVRRLQLNTWLCGEISMFKWLVELRLVSVVIKGRICSQSVRRLVIKLCRAEEEIVEIECPNIVSLEYEANIVPFRLVNLSDPRDLRYEFLLLQDGRPVVIDALEKLFECTSNATENLKVAIFLGPLKDVIIVDGLIEVVLSVFNKIGDSLEPRILITSDSVDWNAILPASCSTVGHLAVNVVSLCGSTLPEVVWEKLLSLQKSRTKKYANVCCVERDCKKGNIPIELEPHQGSQYQVNRIILNFN